MPKLFEGKEKKKEVCPEKAFNVQYLGKTLASKPGVEGIEHSTNAILERTKHEKDLPRMFLTISQEGIHLTDTKGRNEMNRLFPLVDISFALMNARCKKVFAFNHHVSRKPPTAECHALMCDSEEISKDIGNLLYFAFKDRHFLNLRKRRSEGSVSTKKLTLDNIDTEIVNGEVNPENGHTSRSYDSVSNNSSEETFEYTPRSSLTQEPEMFSSSTDCPVDYSIGSAHNDTDYLTDNHETPSCGSTSPRSPCGDQDTRELDLVVNDILKIVEQEKDELNSNPTLV